MEERPPGRVQARRQRLLAGNAPACSPIQISIPKLEVLVYALAINQDMHGWDYRAGADGRNPGLIGAITSLTPTRQNRHAICLSVAKVCL